MSAYARHAAEIRIRALLEDGERDTVNETVQRSDLRALIETIDVLVNADDTEEVEQLRAKLSAAEGALAGYRKLERMDRVAFIRKAFLAIVKGCGNGAGNVFYEDDVVWNMARMAWDTKPEDC